MVDLSRVRDALAGPSALTHALEQMLNRTEIRALRRRVHSLVEAGCYPEPGPGRVVPWPLV